MGLSCFKSWKHDSTGHKGNRDVLASPGSYFFLSNSGGQGDEWLKSLNKGVWIPFTGVFGQRLEETVLYERRYGIHLVPLVVEQCVNFIREQGLHEVGLFRQPGQTSLVKELQEAFDSGERPTFDSSTDVHTVASLLKLYLRQLPEPLVPYSRYQDFLLCAQNLSRNRSLGLCELRTLLHELPVANFNLLNFICQFLNEVQSYSSSNKMSVQNLATVFGPNILRAKAEDPQSIMGGAALVQVLMLELIRENEDLFCRVPPDVSARSLRSSHGSLSALKPPHLQPVPCVRHLSLPIIPDCSGDPDQPAVHVDSHRLIFSAAVQSDVSSGQKRHLGHRYTSSHPENCFHPPPSCSQSVQHRSDTEYYQHDADHDIPPANQQSDGFTAAGWAEAWPEPESSASGIWSTNGVPEEGGVQEGASRGSSEVPEDSTPSAYDNLDETTASPVVENQVDSPGGRSGICEAGREQEEAGQTPHSLSSWSSCDGLPLDDNNDEEKVGPDESPERPERRPSSQKAEGKNDMDHDEEESNNPNSPASCSVPNSPLSTGSSEVFLPSGPLNHQGQELQFEARNTESLVAKLQQQMAQQRAEYQSRIQRLERCNDLLERQVAVLRLSLEQQRRSQSVAEIKIRNMERAKADADRRNSSLQREMEKFFQMCGDIRRREEQGGRGSV